VTFDRPVTTAVAVRLRGIDVVPVRIPLRRPVSHATARYVHRDYVVVRVRTDEGIDGLSYALAGPLVAGAIQTVAPLLIERAPATVESTQHWLYQQLRPLGRRGVAMIALSCLDNALWDIQAKVQGLPLCQLLGGSSSPLPVAIGAALYYEGQSVADVARECEEFVGQGYRAVKIRVGGLPPEKDVQRVAAIRAAIGPDTQLMMNANMAWESIEEALAFLNRVSEVDVHWCAEPIDPDNWLGWRQLAQASPVALASGEQESGRWAFARLVDDHAVAAIQPDVTRAGGVTEWLRIAALAREAALPIVPHWSPDLHVHLGSCTPTLEWLEYLPNHSMVNLDEVLVERLRPQDGLIAPPERPGFGLSFDWKAVDRYRV
jgi:L-alanine-DL-glutamate epimerase-like enolase superfamily enzyme